MCYNKTMKRLAIILTFFLILINTVWAQQPLMKKEISVQSVDGFTIKADFAYPKKPSQKEYKTVVLLHSLGYSSAWWGNLPDELLSDGYAVLKIDLRGHGKSVYNSKLVQTSWKDMTNNAYAKYPDDVVAIIEKIKTENQKKVFFNNWAIVGADIGANTAILVADKVAYKPKTIVMLSPTVDLKGLYIPVKLANLDKTDIFSISGNGDYSAQNVERYLRKFAQTTFATYTSSARSTGMIMLKNDETLSRIIISWIDQYLKKG